MSYVKRTTGGSLPFQLHHTSQPDPLSSLLCRVCELQITVGLIMTLKLSAVLLLILPHASPGKNAYERKTQPNTQRHHEQILLLHDIAALPSAALILSSISTHPYFLTEAFFGGTHGRTKNSDGEIMQQRNYRKC